MEGRKNEYAKTIGQQSLCRDDDVFVLLCAAVFVGLICRKLTLFSGYNRDENGNPHQVSFPFNVKMGAGCTVKHQHDGKTTEDHAVI